MIAHTPCANAAYWGRMSTEPQRGRLHVWLSYAAGVGKTYTVTLSRVRAGPALLERAVAKGLVEATGGTIELEDALGGDLAACIALEAA